MVSLTGGSHIAPQTKGRQAAQGQATQCRRPKAGQEEGQSSPPKRYHFDDPCLAAAGAAAAAIHAEARTGFGGNMRVEGFSTRTSLDGGPVVFLKESPPWYTEVHGRLPPRVWGRALGSSHNSSSGS